MIRLYLIRHGETELNKKGCYYGWTDCELSERGIEQALLLRQTFAKVSLDTVISSDLQRAVDTAAIICRGKELGMLKETRLRELNFGDWEGLHYTEIAQLQKEHWEEWIKDWKNNAPPQGESFEEMRVRVSGCIDEIIEQHEGKNVLIVAHQGVLRIILAHLLDIPSDKIWSFFFEQGAYSVIEFEEDNCVIKGINKQ